MAPDIEMEIANEYGPNSLLLKIADEHVLLDAAELDKLIEQLGAARSNVLPETPREPSNAHQYVLETTTLWRTIRNPLLDGLVVFFRHSGYGWTGFGLPRASIECLSEQMAPLVTPTTHKSASPLYM